MERTVKVIVLENLENFGVISLCVFASNLILNMKAANGVNPFTCIPALILLALVSFAGILLREMVKINVPAIVYTCLLAAILSLPCFPWYQAMIDIMGGLQFNAVLTPILAFTGISVGRDLAGFVKAGPKLLLVSILVFIGTYLGSAMISQIGLILTGQI